jgi:hypothetical protein
MSNYHPVAIARNKWQDSDEYKDKADPQTLINWEAARQYLENRLEAAFIAGWNACDEYEKNRGSK